MVDREFGCRSRWECMWWAGVEVTVGWRWWGMVLGMCEMGQWWVLVEGRRLGVVEVVERGRGRGFGCI